RGHPADPAPAGLFLQSRPVHRPADDSHGSPNRPRPQRPQELSAYRRTTREKGSLVIFFAQANPPPRSAAEAVRRLRHGVDPAHAGGRDFKGFGPSAEFPKPG